MLLNECETIHSLQYMNQHSFLLSMHNIVYYHYKLYKPALFFIQFSDSYKGLNDF
jgi:hypothetical protein